MEFANKGMIWHEKLLLRKIQGEGQIVKILHIDAEQGWRGGQQQAAYLFQALHEKGFDASLACQPGSAFQKYCQDHALPHYAIKMHGEFDFFAGYKIARLCKQHPFDILHLHSAHALAIGLWAKIFNSKIKLIGVRRVDFHINKNWFSKFKYTNRLVDSIVCISDGIKNVLLEDGVPADKLITIHSGIDLNKFKDVSPPVDLKKRYGIPENNIVVGTIAAMVGHKDYPTLLRSAKIVMDNLENVSFCAVGGGPDKEKISALATLLNLGNRFVFADYQKDVGQFLKIFNLFVLASKLEGLGTSILDALAVGLPVIACRTGGIPEVVIHEYNGLLVPPQNERALADAIMLCIRDRVLYDRLRRNALGSVRKFDININVEKNIQLYRKVLL